MPHNALPVTSSCCYERISFSFDYEWTIFSFDYKWTIFSFDSDGGLSDYNTPDPQPY